MSVFLAGCALLILHLLRLLISEFSRFPKQQVVHCLCDNRSCDSAEKTNKNETGNMGLKAER